MQKDFNNAFKRRIKLKRCNAQTNEEIQYSALLTAIRLGDSGAILKQIRLRIYEYCHELFKEEHRLNWDEDDITEDDYQLDRLNFWYRKEMRIVVDRDLARSKGVHLGL